MRRIIQFFLIVVFSGLVSCGGGNQSAPIGNQPPNLPGISPLPEQSTIQYANGFPGVLPVDSVQPWEELGSGGKVISATGASTEFLEGPQTHFESGDTSAWNGALRMASGAVGDGNLSYATYRIPLGGSEPGVVSVDANLRPMSDGNLGGYFVGLADYGNNSWQWFGPVTDAHWRISSVQAARESASFTSGVGNLFVCVVAHDGAEIDLVGVGVDPVDPADSTAPEAPTGLALTPVAGGIELAWTAVGGSDVAGYKLYYHGKAFGEHTAQFANSVEGLQGRTFILDAISQTWVAVSAIDKSGNESAISAVERATPLVGTAPQVAVDVTGYSAMRNEQVSLAASGASLYDWDTDGDGIFDIMGDASGTADVDTSQTGLIRPLVRGTGADSTSVALSAVSVIVSSNARPVAVANVTIASGDAPFDAAFSGTESTDFDGTIVGGGWDFDGDGTYDVWDDADIVHVTSANHTYTTPGVYNAKLRVVDNEGAWDVDTVAVVVNAAPDPNNVPPTAGLSADVTSGDAPLVVELYAGGSTDGDGTIVEYAWDWDGDGGYDTFSDIFTLSHTYTSPGVFTAKVRVTDNGWGRDTATVEITVNVLGNTSPTAGLSATPSSGDTPLDVTLDASGSNDPDGSIVNYEWDFDGDGVYDGNSDGDSAGYTYTSAGAFTAKVRVTDDAGAQATATADVTVSVPGNDSPTAGLSATPTSGDTPLDVALDASGSNDPDGSIVNYEWDFDGDGTYDSYGSGSSTDHTYTTAGVFTAKVRVTDNAGAQATATAEVTVNASPVAILQGSPLTGEDSIDVAFSAADSFDPDGTIDDYEWDFDGDGTYNETGAEADNQGEAAPPLQTYTLGLPVVVNLRVTDNDSANDTTSITVIVHGWATPLAVDTTGDTGWFTSLAVVDGNPAISYQDGSNKDLKYVRATNAAGSSWAAPQTLDSTGNVGYYTSLCVVDGNPAISYYDATNEDLKYVRATDAGGSSWGTPQTLDSTGFVGFYTSLAVVDGNPAISYFDGGNYNLKYVRATNADGSIWGTPQTVDSTGDVGYNSSLSVVDGNPAVSYIDETNGDLKYVRATNVEGSSWAAPQTLDSTGGVGYYSSLSVVDGNPAISYFDGTNRDLKYVRATNADGSIWGTPQTVDSTGDVGKYSSLVVLDGYPAISYRDDTNQDLKFVRLY